MDLHILPEKFSVCKLSENSSLSIPEGLFFLAKTDDELSLVCETAYCPKTLAQADGYRAFRFTGTLDFSLVGILAKLSTALSECKIGIFALSTFDTDYILVKDADLPCAKDYLVKCGYRFV